MRGIEANIQASCVRVFRLKWPEYAWMLFAVPNGGSRNPIEAHNLKLQGVLPGVTDLILLVPNQKHASLCIEMKAGKGRQSDYQKEFQQAAEKYGNKYIICRSVDDFLTEVTSYLHDR